MGKSKELQVMNLRITKASNDFVTSQIEVSCSGNNMEQCKKGIKFLLNEANKKS